jgi:predicted transcriptional regulator of viral defense system
MKLIDFYHRLKQVGHWGFQTRDVAALFDISTSHASKLLSRLVDAGQIVHITHNIWVFADVERFALPALLVAPFPAYISLQSALYYHGMISQIPDIIFAASLARTKLYKTPLATVSIHHLQPDFFFEYDTLKNTLIKMATPEKALIDVFYLSDTKTSLFHSLPEVELADSFSLQKVKMIVEKIPSLRKRTIVMQQLEKLKILP